MTVGLQAGHKPLARRGRAALAWGLLFFVCGQLGLITFLEHRRPDLYDPEYGHRLKQFRALQGQNSDRPLLLLLGSSHTGVGVNPRVMDLHPLSEGRSPLVFNFAHSGSGPILELNAFQRLRAQGITPAWVVIEVVAPYLNKEVLTAVDLELSIRRIAPHDLPVLQRHLDPRKLYSCWLPSWVAPAHTFRRPLLNVLGRFGGTPFREFGWTPLPFSTVRDAEYRRAVAHAQDEYARHFEGFRIADAADQALRELINLCQDAGARVALVRMPEGSAFRSWHPPEARLPVDRYLADLSRQYDVPVFDCRTWMNDDAFWDAHHLLQESASAFSQRYAREMIQPFLDGEEYFEPSGELVARTQAR